MNETINNPNWGKGIPNVKQFRADLEEFTKNEEYVALKQLEEKKEKEYDNIWQPNIFNYPWLKQQLEIDPEGKKIIFIKEESFAIKDRLEFLPDVPTRHAFIIRHPQEVFPSFKNMLVNGMNFAKVPEWDDVHLGDGAPYMPIKDLFQIHHNHWKYVTENLDPDPIIIDGFDLINKPEVILPKFFEKLGIPYKESYLHWEGDPEFVYSSWKGSSEFVVFESQNVITSRAVQSTRFEPPKYARGTPRPEWKLTDELKEYIEAAMPYYDEMYANRLT